MTESLNCLIYGAGAIGTYIGGRLAIHDYRVAYIEKEDVARKLRQEGLHLEIEEKQQHEFYPEIWTKIEDALPNGPFDVVIFALKSYDTESAIKNITVNVESLPPFLCLQNGVENEHLLASVLGEDKVIAGTITSAITRRDAGNAILERKRGMGLYAGHPLSSKISTAFKDAGITVRLYAHASDMKWSKMLTNLLANASSAILDMPPQEIFEHPGLFRLEISQFREALAVMNAQKIRVVDLPGTPVRALSLAVSNLPPGISRSLLQSNLGKGRGKKMPSLHIDFHSNNPRSEVNWLNGAVVRFGDALGIPTPINRTLNDTLLGMIANSISPDSFQRQPEKLIALTGLMESS